MVDLFGRPIYDTPRAKQPALFNDEHWFRYGYRDAAADFGRIMGPSQRSAWALGYTAGERDLAAGRHSPENEERALRQAVAVGNVEG